MLFFKRKSNPEEANQETSGNFEMIDLPDLLPQIAAKIPFGFGSDEIQLLIAMAQSMAVDDEKENTFSITYDGRRQSFTVGIFMDDIDAPDMSFLGPPALITAINEIVKRFNDERER